MQRAAGLKAVGVRRNSAHGVEGDGAAGHGHVMFAAEVCPLVVQLKCFFERDACQFCGDGADAFSGYANTVCNGFGGVLFVEIHLGHLVEDRFMRDASVAVCR